MKRYVIFGGIVIVCVTVMGIFFFSSADNQQGRSGDSTPGINEDRADTTDPSQPSRDSEDEPTAITEADGARYINYSAESFKKYEDQQRILIFIDSTVQNSVALDSLLESSLTDLPTDVVLYKTLMDKNRDVATTLGVTQAGVAIKFDTDGNLAGIYIAPETPDLAIFKSSLMLDETPATD